MSAYFYITLSLLLYPVIGYFLIRLTRKLPSFHKYLVVVLSVVSLLVIIATLTHTITISQNLNWFLITSVYLSFSILVCLTQNAGKKTIKTIGKTLMSLVFGLGYVFSTVGFFFIMIASEELETQQNRWLSDDLLYKERNIGAGPDPSVSLKKIEVYERLPWLPFLATRIEARTYDMWNLPLQRLLDVSYSENKEALYLSSVVTGYKIFNFSDTINLAKKYR